jgi:hypothetical protein
LIIIEFEEEIKEEISPPGSPSSLKKNEEIFNSKLKSEIQATPPANQTTNRKTSIFGNFFKNLRGTAK